MVLKVVYDIFYFNFFFLCSEAEQSAFSGPMPTNLNEAQDRLKAMGGELVGKGGELVGQAQEKCSIQ